jgi:hypothetical protein
MFPIKRIVSKKGPWRVLGAAALSAALSVAPAALAQDEAEDEADRENVEPGDVEDETDEDSNAATTPSTKVKVETGAPRPSAQTPGVAPPAPPPNAPPPPPTIKVGGGFILALFHPYNMKGEARNQGRPTPKPNFETFRAAILLDSKIDRFGVHIEFRARDKRVREFYEGTAWLEEIYGSVDIMRPENPLGSLTLKVGKAYTQFGRFWDDSFYGNVHLRDGLKLDPNYGLSLEGQIGKGQAGMKYYGQYFIIDGGTNTSLAGRDTISNAAPLSGHPPTAPIGGTATSLARKRNMFVGRIEPFFALNPTTVFKIAGSIQNYTADFGPTVDQENVLRYGGDITANVAWFGAWAEYTVQKGYSTFNHPFAAGPAGANPFNATRSRAEAAPGTSSENTHYLLAGGRFFWKGIMLRYNFSRGTYNNVPLPIGNGARAQLTAMGIRNFPSVDVVEKMHVPGIMITATQQLFMMIEAPIHKRVIPSYTLGRPSPEQTLVLDRSIVVTLHARI